MSKTNPFAIRAEFAIQAAAGEGESVKTPTFSIEAYSGGAIRQYWSKYPMVVDLAGMQATTPMPALYGHSGDGGFTGKPLDGLLGQVLVADNTGRNLRVAGEMIGEGDTFDRVISLSKKGLKFQASIGADVHRTEFVEAGQKVTVNGQEFTGPISVVRASTLREVSIVLMGADPNTSAAIAAEANDGGFPMADHANQTPAEAVKASAEATANVAAEKTPASAPAPEHVKAVDADAIAAKVLEQLKADIKAEALAGIRADRPAAPAVQVVAKQEPNDDVLVAALCLAGNLPGVEKQFSEKTLEAASKQRNIGLQEMLLRAAKANGFDQDVYSIKGDAVLREVLRAAFQPSVKASFATHSIANVTGTAYGKFLLNGFTTVESVWDRISMIRPVNDFKQVTGIRVNGGFEFEEVGAAGELKSAEATDEARSFGAKTYGRISTITRRDIINDDLGALTAVPQRLGYGAATKFNKVFWAEFEASNASYYAKKTAAAGNAFSIDSLEAAVLGFNKQTNPDGGPLGVPPSTLLVPMDLEIPAMKVMGSQLLIGGSSVSTASNIFAGRYQIVSSFYLSSASTWWLVANPNALNAMEVLFLNGNRTPVIEQASADFDTLGIQVRGYWDFGVAKGESRSCYRMATS